MLSNCCSVSVWSMTNGGGRKRGKAVKIFAYDRTPTPTRIRRAPSNYNGMEKFTNKRVCAQSTWTFSSDVRHLGVFGVRPATRRGLPRWVTAKKSEGSNVAENPLVQPHGYTVYHGVCSSSSQRQAKNKNSERWEFRNQSNNERQDTRVDNSQVVIANSAVVAHEPHGAMTPRAERVKASALWSMQVVQYHSGRVLRSS